MFSYSDTMVWSAIPTEQWDMSRYITITDTGISLKFASGLKLSIKYGKYVVLVPITEQSFLFA